MSFNAADAACGEIEMGMIEAMFAVMLGIGAGAWGYRYILRRDPAALERMAAQIRAAGRNLGSDR